jgi:acyl dehydratase
MTDISGELKVKFQVGDSMPEFVTPAMSRTHFVRYAGASGDFNPMHHDDVFAKAKGSPQVFGQGMLTAGILGQAIARWVGPCAIRSFRTRFSGQVWPGDVLTCGSKVVRVYDEGELLRVELECWVKNQSNRIVLNGAAVVGPYTN